MANSQIGKEKPNILSIMILLFYSLHSVSELKETGRNK